MHTVRGRLGSRLGLRGQNHVSVRGMSTTPSLAEFGEVLAREQRLEEAARVVLDGQKSHKDQQLLAFGNNGPVPEQHGLESQWLGKLSRSKVQQLARLMMDWTMPAVRAFLPTGFPHSFPRGGRPFLRYSVLGFIANILGAAGSVISTQAMLLSLGLTAVQAAPAAAAFNWIAKDLLGQVGGAFISSRAGQLFDQLPGYHRLRATKLVLFASALEMLTPLCPTLFVAVGAAANMLKNIAWLALGATKASANNSFSNGGNLGDITAKGGLQATAAGVLGTSLGAAATYAQALSQPDIPTHVAQSMVLFVVLGSVSYLLTKLAMREVVSTQLSPQVLAAIRDEHTVHLTPEIYSSKLDISRPYEDAQWSRVQIHVNNTSMPITLAKEKNFLQAQINTHSLGAVHQSQSYFESQPFFVIVQRPNSTLTPSSTTLQKKLTHALTSQLSISCPKETYIHSLSNTPLEAHQESRTERFFWKVTESLEPHNSKVLVYMKQGYSYEDVLVANLFALSVRECLVKSPSLSFSELMTEAEKLCSQNNTRVLDVVHTHWSTTQSHLLLQNNGYVPLPWTQGINK